MHYNNKVIKCNCHCEIITVLTLRSKFKLKVWRQQSTDASEQWFVKLLLDGTVCCWSMCCAHTINYAVPYTFPAVTHCTFRCRLPLHSLSISAVTLLSAQQMSHPLVCQISWKNQLENLNGFILFTDSNESHRFEWDKSNFKRCRKKMCALQNHPCWILNWVYACTNGCVKPYDFSLCSLLLSDCAIQTRLIVLFSCLYVHILYMWRVRRQTNRRWYRNMCIYTYRGACQKKIEQKSEQQLTQCHAPPHAHTTRWIK